MDKQWRNLLVVALMTSSIRRICANSATTFLRVADNLEAPGFTVQFNDVTIAGCGMECYKARFENCLGFQWRPPVDNAAYDQTELGNSIDDPSSTSKNCTQTPLVGSTSLGTCGLLKCVPSESSLTNAPGSQIYFYRGKSAIPFGSIKAPPSYGMACTFAYRVFDKNFLSYSDAEKQCAMDGARLLTIKSSDEDAEIQMNIRSSDGYWIGLSDRQDEGVWTFSDGSTPSYQNWDSGQPNNILRNGEDQDCVMLFQGAWNDNQCSQKLRFICQIMFIEI